MAEAINIHAAKTQFSKLVERAEAGEEILIARSGRPVARLAPLAGPARRVPGGAEGAIVVHTRLPPSAPQTAASRASASSAASARSSAAR